jgi:hypothetical protein
VLCAARGGSDHMGALDADLQVGPRSSRSAIPRIRRRSSDSTTLCRRIAALTGPMVVSSDAGAGHAPKARPNAL